MNGEFFAPLVLVLFCASHLGWIDCLILNETPKGNKPEGEGCNDLFQMTLIHSLFT